MNKLIEIGFGSERYMEGRKDRKSPDFRISRFEKWRFGFRMIPA